MSNIKIIVEGTSDKKFITDYLSHLGFAISGKDFIELGGKDHANFQKVIPSMISRGQEGRNLVIIDLDDDDIQRRKSDLNELLDSNNVDAFFFFFPDNSKTGELEDLLMMIIQNKHSGIFTCFDQYQECLDRKDKGYKVPSKKAKIYAYLDAMLAPKDEKLAKDEYRNFLNTEHWFLGHASIRPLKIFLETHLS